MALKMPVCDVRSWLLAAPGFSTRLNADFGFVPQIVWVLGPLVEQAVLQISEHPRTWGEDWIEKSALTSSGLPRGVERNAFLRNYLRKSAEALLASDVVAVAADDSRCGREPWKLVCWMLPQLNLAGWMPPQA